MAERLHSGAVDRLPASVHRWSYPRDRLTVGIVHLGLGAFHRAHQAALTELALECSFGPFAICGVSLRSPEVRDRLAPQDGLYTVATRDQSSELRRVIGCVKELMVGPEDPAALVRRIADPAIAVVSLTVTEKGYCHDPASGRLDPQHPDIRHDLSHPGRPRSAPGVLVAALDRCRGAGLAPPTVMSCDNLPANGRLLRRVVVALAALQDEALARWIEAEVAFPSTMVDRIVPATTAADVRAIGERLGLDDRAPVVCEPFRQWVIEDCFGGPRPPWEAAGAELAADVAPYEEMKLRLLNGSHSALAYLGQLAGIEHVFEVMRVPELVTFMARMMAEEVAPTLDVATDLKAYQTTLIERFTNPALAHETAQIAMDGSQKLPQRLLGTIRDQLAAGGPVRHLTLALAAWMRWVTRLDAAGRPIPVVDPLAPRLASIAAEAGSDPDALVRGLLGIREVFDDELQGDPRLVAAVTTWLGALITGDARAVVADCISG